MTEIAFVPAPQGMVAGQFSGIFIFTGAARMMRPVFNIAAKDIEYIGTLEQVLNPPKTHRLVRVLFLV
jgi:DNA-directed RNA polymerase I subunit RPA2